MKKYKIRSTVLMLGDLTVFYIGLLLTLAVRYNLSEFENWWKLHLIPFSVLFAIWIVIFMLAGLYDPFMFSAQRSIREQIIRAMLLSGAVSIAIFYIWTQTVITPKTNLLVDIGITVILLFGWRRLYENMISKADKTRVIFFGWSSETRELSNILRDNSHLGYEPVAVILPKDALQTTDINLPIYVFDGFLPEIIQKNNINLVVASFNITKNDDFIKMIYEVLPTGVAYINFPEFYERITGKVPVSMISRMWFLENLKENEKRIYETAKRTFDVCAGIILGLVSILIWPFAVIAIKLDTTGPIFFRQNRVGKNGRIFGLNKFRSKEYDEVWKNSGWDKDEDKKRTTFSGKILRKSYIDELPQALNIIKGEMSLIGPRPERPEFVDELKKNIPHYMMRLLVRPGISGWAQINMKYDASAADALEKLQYDLYYIKNRSLGLDMSIALKTLFTMLSHSGK